MDEEGLSWDEAWKITKNTVSYTNHTILPEALEKWPVDIVKSLLPRIFMILEEINERFCRELWERYPGSWDLISSMAIIADGYVNMAHLAIVGSYSVNGVAKIHTEILKKEVVKNSMIIIHISLIIKLTALRIEDGWSRPTRSFPGTLLQQSGHVG